MAANDGTPVAIRVTCTAPVNIAVIKYWGKSDEDLILPLNSSLSVTLHQDDLCTTTTVALSRSFDRDRIWLNGMEDDISGVRLQNCLSTVRKFATASSNRFSPDEVSKLRIHICSKNNFPTAAGLASSASGFACLVYTLAKAFGIENCDLSEIARRGSGSACRSMYGGFVEWEKGEPDGTRSRAVQVAPVDHWPDMEVLVLVVSDRKKEVSSSKGMQTTVQTSSLIKHRVEEIVPQRMIEMKKAIENKDFESFGLLTMKDSNQFHSVCLDTYPPIFYLSDVSKYIITLITAYNRYKGRVTVAYTFDAGPNAVLLAPAESIPELLSLVLHYLPPPSNARDYIRSKQFSVNHKPIDETLTVGVGMTPIPDALEYILHTKVGPGPVMVAMDSTGNPSSHLLDNSGLPDDNGLLQ